MYMYQTLCENLKFRKKKQLNFHAYTPSAVLVPLFSKNNEDHLLFTVRTQEVKDHKGEVCFPGGVRDLQDKTLLFTALRECQEELGLDPRRIEVLGELDDLVTPTRYHISPFVGKIPYPYPFQVNSSEMSEMLEIPVNFFTHVKETSLKEIDYFGQKVKMPVYYWEKHQIWGATAKMVQQLLELTMM